MSHVFFYFLFLITSIFPALSRAHDNLAFKAEQRDYTFSTVFELDANSDSFGCIVKSVFRIRTNYDVYSSSGDYEGVGVCRLLTLGSFYDWAREIDVYDEQGNWIGMIDGQVVTGASAKFSIYNHKDDCVGIAYLDHSNSAFTICDPDNDQKHLVSLKRNFIEDAIDSWDVQVFNKKAIDLRIIKIFAGFAVDTQDFFKKDI